MSPDMPLTNGGFMTLNDDDMQTNPANTPANAATDGTEGTVDDVGGEGLGVGGVTGDGGADGGATGEGPLDGGANPHGTDGGADGGATGGGTDAGADGGADSGTGSS
jgi:hypothetical protein